jgi:sporulation protein YpjB
MLHHKAGLWLNYYKVMSEQFKSMNLAQTNGDKEKLQAAISQLNGNYQLIRPAAVIVRDASTISQFDSWLSYASKLSEQQQPDWEVWKGLLSQGELALNQLFGKATHDPVFLPIIYNQHPWRLVLLISGWILLSLLYTAWRKYKGEQDHIVTLP